MPEGREYERWIWTELIGFDVEQPDLGVGRVPRGRRVYAARYLPAHRVSRFRAGARERAGGARSRARVLLARRA